MPSSEFEIVNLSGKGLPQSQVREAAKWMALSFAQAPAKPALAIFFGPSSYKDNVEMHEAFWSSHLNRVAMSGTLLGCKENDEWRGFRCFFEPGKGRQPYDTSFALDQEEEDWKRFLQLTGKSAYEQRVKEWAKTTGRTHDEIGLNTSNCFTTSILVVDPSHQRKHIGQLLDEETRRIVHAARGKLFVRIHEFILPFYIAQGYRVVASPVYTLGELEPFGVHFLVHDVARTAA